MLFRIWQMRIRLFCSQETWGFAFGRKKHCLEKRFVHFTEQRSAGGARFLYWVREREKIFCVGRSGGQHVLHSTERKQRFGKANRRKDRLSENNAFVFELQKKRSP